MDSSKLIIRDLEIMMSIGVHDHEKQAPQKVLINIEIDLNSTPDSSKDKIDDVLSYDDVIQDVEKLCGSGHINLVETLAEDIAAAILKYEEAAVCKVKIEKPDVYDNAQGVGIEITRSGA